ncbi:hypothetical protein JZQ54_004997 [Salmonella enterica subsp. enterica serovar 4,5,12:b:-]|nr:hypothetical protein [Salmonella enterica]EHF1448744.1 hypothetical protein [Salmonella enterica subsp. enterica serovar 4,5,12:b:-]EHG1528848.1 hypothetical protein [Salmonella enterica subsp. enterica serovar 4,[5],12:b:-]EFB0477841.1 hypothetical protein [Salmonella enterica]EFQ4600782.1 hypothetical protein [Salmonella enterica]
MNSTHITKTPISCASWPKTCLVFCQKAAQTSLHYYNASLMKNWHGLNTTNKYEQSYGFNS